MQLYVGMYIYKILDLACNRCASAYVAELAHERYTLCHVCVCVHACVHVPEHLRIVVLLITGPHS